MKTAHAMMDYNKQTDANKICFLLKNRMTTGIRKTDLPHIP